MTFPGNKGKLASARATCAFFFSMPVAFTRLSKEERCFESNMFGSAENQVFTPLLTGAGKFSVGTGKE